VNEPLACLLQKYNTAEAIAPLPELLSAPGRYDDFHAELNGLLLDYSRVRLDRQAHDSLLTLVRECGLDDARERLFAGADVNPTEVRPAMHMLLRGGCEPPQALADAQQALSAVECMLDLAAELHRGRLPGAPGEKVEDIVHIGIGGSLLGTRLIHEALGQAGSEVPRVHFLGSVDAHAREALLPRLQPETTLVVAVSKSFTTGDTLLHARRLRDWLAQRLDGPAVQRRMYAVTGATAKAAEFGIPKSQSLYLPEWVGGRYSLWSPVSLSAAATMGPDAFRALLEGAADMDRHFRTAPDAHNLPVIMALNGVWHRNVCGFGSWAVFPYDQRLRLLPSHLQQLVMESNGKSVMLSGESCAHATSPVVFGESGTEAQHSVFQALHQGSDVVPVNFVGVVRPHHDDHEAHAELLANMLAQATALACGRSASETLAQMQRAGVKQAERLLPHRTFGGNRPSEVLLMDELTPAGLGRLLALYEHKVFAESVIWSINAFDQWGVELGKQLAPGVQRGLAGGSCDSPGLAGLLGHIRGRS